MDQPNQIAVDAEGNLLVTTVYGRTVRKITPEGYVSTYAGIGYQTGYVDGLAAEAKFNKPYGIAIDSGNQRRMIVRTNNWYRKLKSIFYVQERNI